MAQTKREGGYLHPRPHFRRSDDLGRRVHELADGHHPPSSAPHLRILLELLEAEGHDVIEFREELAHLLRALLRARHAALNVAGRRAS